MKVRGSGRDMRYQREYKSVKLVVQTVSVSYGDGYNTVKISEILCVHSPALALNTFVTFSSLLNSSFVSFHLLTENIFLYVSVLLPVKKKGKLTPYFKLMSALCT